MQKKIVFFIIIIAFFRINAQDIGSPFIVNYSPKQYQGHAQIWTIAEDQNGILYFGTTNGITVFDGEYWRKIVLPQNSNVRSLYKSNSGKVYVGGSNEIGILTPDSLGKMKYKSLLHLIDSSDNKFADVWEIYETKNCIFFRSNQRVFRFNEKTQNIKAWKPNKRFNPMSFVPGVGIIIRDGNIFYTIKNDDTLKLPQPEKYKGVFIYRMFPYENGKAICVTEKELLLYDFKAPKGVDPLTKFKTQADEDFKTTHLYMGCPLGDTAYAITTLTKGVYIINKKGKLLEIINKDDGLQYNHVWISFLASDKTLWLGLDKGISRVDISSPVRFWNNKTGLDDGINSVFKFKDKLLAAGMAGAYKIDFTNNGKLTKFKGLTYNAWNYTKIKGKQSENKKLLLATSKGVYSFDGKKINPLKYISYNYHTPQSNINNEVFYATSMNAVYAFNLANNDLKIIDTVNFDGLAIRCIEINNQLWITTFFKGVYRINVTPKSDEKIFLEKTLSKYDTLKGFESNLQLKAYNIDNKIFFTTQEGLFKYDNKTDSILKATEFGEKLNKNANSCFYQISDKYYFVSSRRIFKFIKTDTGFKEIDTSRFKIISGRKINYVTADSSDNVFAAGFDGIYYFNANKTNKYSEKYPIYIRKVAINLDSVVFFGNYTDYKGNPINKQPDSLIPKIKYENNSMYFEFAAPHFQGESEVLYSYKLEGFDENWSEWNEEAKNKYTNLNEGKYTFKVKAKNIFDTESYVAQYKFVILPPWYRTLWAFIFYIIVAGVIIFFVVRFYTQRLRRQNVKLERLVAQRTSEINQQKEEILTKNEELLQQQEEILSQRDKLEQANEELEKLSIVASETDNSVFILNSKGDFIWANQAFERIYEYSHNEFIKKYKNIFKYVKDEQLAYKIKEIVFNGKKPFKYDSQISTKSGKNLWLQTTFSPILNSDNSIRVVAAIESDISKLKEFEAEIVLKNSEIESQNEDLKEKNELIESSIRYASTIQNAILPPKNFLNTFFDNFIIFRPKDVVSGDFYWFIETSKYTFFAVVDCTGHGVPGAFMSLIGNKILSNIVLEKQIFSPADILAELDNQIVKTLHQQDTDNQDGMDLILCRFDKNFQSNAKMTYSTAKRPIIFVKDNKLTRLKGSSKSIGGYKFKSSNIKFENNQISFNSGDMLYLYSDGIIDQNNPQREKFKTSKLTNIIEKIYQLDTNEQRKTIENELDDWKKDSLQRDDITFVGIKFK